MDREAIYRRSLTLLLTPEGVLKFGSKLRVGENSSGLLAAAAIGDAGAQAAETRAGALDAGHHLDVAVGIDFASATFERALESFSICMRRVRILKGWFWWLLC